MKRLRWILGALLVLSLVFSMPAMAGASWGGADMGGDDPDETDCEVPDGGTESEEDCEDPIEVIGDFGVGSEPSNNAVFVYYSDYGNADTDRHYFFVNMADAMEELDSIESTTLRELDGFAVGFGFTPTPLGASKWDSICFGENSSDLTIATAFHQDADRAKVRKLSGPAAGDGQVVVEIRHSGGGDRVIAETSNIYGNPRPAFVINNAIKNGLVADGYDVDDSTGTFFNITHATVNIEGVLFQSTDSNYTVGEVGLEPVSESVSGSTRCSPQQP